MTDTTTTAALVSDPVEGLDLDAVIAQYNLGELTADERNLLTILLNPDNDENSAFLSDDPHEIAAEIQDDFGTFAGSDAYANVELVFNLLRAHFDRAATDQQVTAGHFQFWYVCNADGDIGGYQVGVNLGDDDDLSGTWDTKYLANGDRSATGLRAALNYAVVLTGDYLRLLTQARTAELIPASSRDWATARALVSEPLAEVFHGEIANERHGGVTPATLAATLDSIAQGLPLSAEFGEADMAALRAIGGLLPPSTPVADLL